MASSHVQSRIAFRWLLAALAALAFGVGVQAVRTYRENIVNDDGAGTSLLQPPQVMLSGGTKMDPRWQRIELRRHGAIGKNVAVTLGIPFPPGMLRDANEVRIVDEHGDVLPSHVEPTLYWHFQDSSIRAVRVQFHVELDGDNRALRFTVEPADGTRQVDGWPYVDGLVENADGVRVPGVLAMLSPEWMSASLIAGPQQPALSPGPYDRYFAAQFKWAQPLPRDEGSSWLFDRPTTLFQQYVRTGREDYLAAASESYRYYMEHLRRIGGPGWPLCGGGWSLGKVSVCDPKYVYVEPILFALALTGDDSEHDPALIERMIGAWDTGGWNFPAGPYTKPEQRFTEREAGLGLLATVSAYEITGDKRYLKRIDDRLGWLYQHQQHNPDGLGDDGSWRNSWQAHEGDSYDAASDVRGTSPWMTENIIDGLWHAWLVTGDWRIPPMITGFGRYLEHHGWIDLKTIAGKDWRDTCSGHDGQISWYWSSAHASDKQLIAIENSDGWFSDAHDVEMTLPVAAARYFETDPVQQRALDQRLARLSSSYSLDCAANGATPRRFNWNNRGVGVVQWLMRQFDGSTRQNSPPVHGGKLP
ncbi:hypothetical protein [Rhodanobacter sp. C03]|uniref:hypothetical protein n=1 Tax=Rhodanobacter sp. C03 TaxID=1945858 RepID=UPI00157D89BF|nr:hypothetical protein [Rhodanobacter sp. C03]